jgi:tetratricopeptide (TPR) repeat protein
MTGSDDKRLCRLLYAYELDLLDAEQRDEFEIHLLDCPRCRREAEEFLPTARLLKHDREIRGFVEGVESGGTPPSGRRRYLTALVAVAAVVTLLVLGPWQFELGPTQEAIASENRMAVLYLPGSDDAEANLEMGRTIVNLLATDLSESEYLQVVSAEHLSDVARRLGYGYPARINRGQAARLAREVNARWMLTAGFVSDGAERQLITQLTEVAGGELRASHREVADSSATVFTLVDRMSAQLRGDVSLPRPALHEKDPSIADITTHSVKAYQFYLKGVELTHRLYFDDALEYFRKAVKLDSTFAMAYYQLSVYSSPGYITQAVKYIDRATKKDQLFIRAQNALLNGKRDEGLAFLSTIVTKYPDDKTAFFQMGYQHYLARDFMKAIYYLEQARRLDPYYKRPPNLLAYSYAEMGRLDDALNSLDEYSRVAPNEANPWDSRGDILARYGRLDEAIDAYREAIKIKPDFRPPGYKLFLSLLHNGQYEEAEAWISSWEPYCHPDTCSDVHSTRFQTLVYRGRYREAFGYVDKTIAAEHVQLETWCDYDGVAWSHGLKASLLLELDSSATSEVEKAIRFHTERQPDDRVNYRVSLARCYIHAGNLGRAEEILTRLGDDLTRTNQTQRLYWLGMGYLEMARGNAAQAADHFKRSADVGLGRSGFVPRFLQGRALLEAGRADRAVEILERQAHSFTQTRMAEVELSPKVYYYLGIAYEETERKEEAIEQFETFLGIWKDADRDLPEYIDARARLNRLKSTS